MRWQVCGITGIVARNVSHLMAPLKRATAALAHRGPDGEGFHSFDECILGHRRLAIIDLATGHQPMTSPDGRVALTFNGMIYGFRELRQDLEHEYPFRTQSDTEVILALYDAYGSSMMTRLPGMFAFAIWDDRTRTLFAARDRFGQKPLFYARGRGGELIFASEIKAILASGLVSPSIDRESLGHYLRRSYVPVDRTIWSEIHTLPPAHSLTFRDGLLEINRYWDLPEPMDAIGVGDAIEEFRRLFRMAVARTLVADVPVTSFLSGGLDSTSVVSIASELHPDLSTISFGFDSIGSELSLARGSSTRYKTNHHEILEVDFDLSELLERMAVVFDEPHADSSSIPTYLVCSSARERAKVVITGEGGDELLAGYPTFYQPLRSMESWSRQIPSAQKLGSLLGRIARGFRFPYGSRTVLRLEGARLARLHDSVISAHTHPSIGLGADSLRRLGLETSADRLPLYLSNTVDDALRFDLTSLLPAKWLTRADRSSMANGIELRSPFLDDDFATFCIGLPARLKITKREEKWILRRAFDHSWTSSVAKKKKQGFAPNVARWLEDENVERLRSRILDDPRHPIYEILPFDPARSLAHSKVPVTWIMLTLGLWAERWHQAR